MQTRTLWIGAAVLVLAAACNRNNTQTSGNAQDAGSAQATNITLTGCLQAGEQGLAPEPGAPASDQFVLANAKTPASPAAGANDPAAPLYILEGKKDELRPHLSHQVEVTGRLNNSAPAPTNAQRFDVDSIRMIAPTC